MIITTKYHRRSERISATSDDGTRVYIPYRYDIPTFHNHVKAVQKLNTILQLNVKLIAGETEHGFIFLPIDKPFRAVTLEA